MLEAPLGVWWRWMRVISHPRRTLMALCVLLSPFSLANPCEPLLC